MLNRKYANVFALGAIFSSLVGQSNTLASDYTESESKNVLEDILGKSGSAFFLKMHPGYLNKNDLSSINKEQIELLKELSNEKIVEMLDSLDLLKTITPEQIKYLKELSHDQEKLLIWNRHLFRDLTPKQFERLKQLNEKGVFTTNLNSLEIITQDQFEYIKKLDDSNQVNLLLKNKELLSALTPERLEYLKKFNKQGFSIGNAELLRILKPEHIGYLKELEPYQVKFLFRNLELLNTINPQQLENLKKMNEYKLDCFSFHPGLFKKLNSSQANYLKNLSDEKIGWLLGVKSPEIIIPEQRTDLWEKMSLDVAISMSYNKNYLMENSTPEQIKYWEELDEKKTMWVVNNPGVLESMNVEQIKRLKSLDGYAALNYFDKLKLNFKKSNFIRRFVNWISG